jgi:hypothetical protein
MMSNFAHDGDIEWAGKLGAVKTISKSNVTPTDVPGIVREMIKGSH